MVGWLRLAALWAGARAGHAERRRGARGSGPPHVDPAVTSSSHKSMDSVAAWTFLHEQAHRRAAGTAHGWARRALDKGLVGSSRVFLFYFYLIK